MSVASRRLRFSQSSRSARRASSVALTVSMLEYPFQRPAVREKPESAEHDMKSQMNGISRHAHVGNVEWRQLLASCDRHHVDDRIEREIEHQRHDDDEADEKPQDELAVQPLALP